VSGSEESAQSLRVHGWQARGARPRAAIEWEAAGMDEEKSSRCKVMTGAFD